MLKLKRIIFYVLSFTWGALTSVPGLMVILVSLPFKKVYSYHGRLYAVWGEDWGGLGLGCFFICSEGSSEHLKAHESGHGLQNILMGPFFLLLVGIPSIIRYWYRELRYYKRGELPSTAYDNIWFEEQATKWGNKLVSTDKI